MSRSSYKVKVAAAKKNGRAQVCAPLGVGHSLIFDCVVLQVTVAHRVCSVYALEFST